MTTENTSQKTSSKYQLTMALAALGVVYGDIGTSPLYALKEAFHHGHIAPTPENIFGILSLVFWSLIIVISVKYLVFVLKADYKGEGGILALTSLINSNTNGSVKPKLKIGMIFLGLFGAAFLYGDGIITPAISILSAVEGLSIITPSLNSFVIPITILILITLFSIQQKGTGSIGKIFGPVTLTWFFAIGAIGFYNILEAPQIIAAINPAHAWYFFSNDFFTAFLVLGSVFLVVTGGEALYSDLGHFGLSPIRNAWFYIVLPCLLLNYFGQGAFLLTTPDGVANPFYLMTPKWFLYPMVTLATLATTIASQALITGVFSITMQAVQQGYLPRFLIHHTSETEYGQIFIKGINNTMMIGCIVLVLVFRSSSNLAAAYGLAVTGTMIITTILFYMVAVNVWNWNRPRTFLLCSLFGIIDLAFVASNSLKFFDGGWLPIALGFGIFILMTTWKQGREILRIRLSERSLPLEQFLDKIKTENPIRVPGVGVFMSRDFKNTPIPLLQTYTHFKTTHEHLIFVSVEITGVSKVSNQDRYKLNQFSDNCFTLNIYYGFLEKPDIPEVFKSIQSTHSIFDPDTASFFIGRENIFATDLPGMALWRERLFSLMSKNETPATQYFKMPRERVVEIGTQVAI